ncbi:U6 snRNA-associated Sm-like protein LSm8 [Pseudolycoriella hygida]|uniref:U6 snRNA-associated Sm-like protein LSm8 n=1 Tax=Pseudolycoriella hygida TaxID=35572 RepID=A0A9Q0NBJ6_9DIPT|nr:U6 snRNA-associated Sm-like protein LSm8 [Pseudolycoriella hygida]
MNMAGLESYVNNTVSIITSDGRNFVGTLKGFDQTINIILDESHERVFSTTAGIEQIVLGLHIIRGDNIAVIGQIDEVLDSRLDFHTIRGEPLGPVTQGVHHDKSLIYQFVDIGVVNESKTTRTNLLCWAMECQNIGLGHYCLMFSFIQISALKVTSCMDSVRLEYILMFAQFVYVINGAELTIDVRHSHSATSSHPWHNVIKLNKLPSPNENRYPTALGELRMKNSEKWLYVVGVVELWKAFYRPRNNLNDQSMAARRQNWFVQPIDTNRAFETRFMLRRETVVEKQQNVTSLQIFFGNNTLKWVVYLTRISYLYVYHNCGFLCGNPSAH